VGIQWRSGGDLPFFPSGAQGFPPIPPSPFPDPEKGTCPAWLDRVENPPSGKRDCCAGVPAEALNPTGDWRKSKPKGEQGFYCQLAFFVGTKNA
jgi:hypothetical protein